MKKKTLFLILFGIILLALNQTKVCGSETKNETKIVGFIHLSTDQISHNFLGSKDLKNIKEEITNLAKKESDYFVDSSFIDEEIILEAMKDPLSFKKLFDVKPPAREKNISLTKGIFTSTSLGVRFNPSKNVLEIITIKKSEVEKTSIPAIIILTLVLIVFKLFFSLLSDQPKTYGWERNNKRDNRNIKIFIITSIILLFLFFRMLIYASFYNFDNFTTKIMLSSSILGVLDNILAFRNKWTRIIITILLFSGMMYTLFFL